MKNKVNIQLKLTESERKSLRKNKIKKSEILDLGSDELEVLLEVSEGRAKEIYACVEDQFRLAVDFAKNQNYTKNWWDFTSERKAYRSKHGYPKDRPTENGQRSIARDRCHSDNFYLYPKLVPVRD